MKGVKTQQLHFGFVEDALQRGVKKAEIIAERVRACLDGFLRAKVSGPLAAAPAQGRVFQPGG